MGLFFQHMAIPQGIVGNDISLSLIHIEMCIRDSFKGVASAALSQSETAMSKANPMYSSLYCSLTQYFGTQPMTSGPVYVGAFVLFLYRE